MNKLLLEKDVYAAYRLFYGRSCTAEEVKYAIYKLHNFYFLKEYILSSSELKSRGRKEATKNIIADNEMIDYAYIILLGRFPHSYSVYNKIINRKESLYALVNGLLNKWFRQRARKKINKYFLSDNFNAEDKVIYLHVPKCAGSSFDRLATKNEGERVFLIRRTGFKKSWYYGKTFIGGHRPINYYDASSSVSLYLAVLRHPVERAISLFNYFKERNRRNHKNYDRRMKRGFNPNSLMDTINNSGFRSQFIDNAQCRYISAHNTCEETIQIIKKNRMILTTMDHLDEGIEYISNALGWNHNRLSGRQRTTCIDKLENIGDDVLDYLRSKNSDDLALYEYIKNEKILDTRIIK